jgi:hypothetical protein
MSSIVSTIKFSTLQSLPQRGSVSTATADTLLSIDHNEIAKFLGNGDKQRGESLLGRVSNLKLAQALIYDLKQSPEYSERVKPFEVSYPSLQRQLELTQRLANNHLATMAQLNQKIARLERFIHSLKLEIAPLQQEQPQLLGR